MQSEDRDGNDDSDPLAEVGVVEGDAVYGDDGGDDGGDEGDDVVMDDNGAATFAPPIPRRKRSTESSSFSSSRGKRKAGRIASRSSFSGSGNSGSRTRPVVKLLVTSAPRSYAEPWRRRPQSSGAGTGFLVRLSSSDSTSPMTAPQGSSNEDNGNDDNDDGNENKDNIASAATLSSRGSVGSLRIVTNAHVVRCASTVRARASFGPVVVSCAVEWLSLPLDLALLRIIDEDEFLRGWGASANVPILSTTAIIGSSADVGSIGGGSSNVDEKAQKGGRDENTTAQSQSSPQQTPSPPLQSTTIQRLTLSTDLPSLDENVTCVGFPHGGTQISVTRGVVSRIDVDGQSVLRIQIDAAINSGNSGGPVFDERGCVVGVASSTLRGAGNIGYIVPGKIVDMFLSMCRDGIEADAEQRHGGLGSLVATRQPAATGGGGLVEEEPKHVPGIPHLGFYGAQALESKALRRDLGLKSEDLSGGVRIAGMNRHFEAPPDDGANCLRSNDVVLKLNGKPIGMDGTVRLSPSRPDERINFRSLVTCRRVGSKVTLDVLREKERKVLEVTLTTGRYLIPKYDELDASPLYVVCGGCVFCPLSMPLINEKTGKRKNPMAGFNRYYHEQRQHHDQVIVLSKVLADEVNVGYHGYGNMVLTSVNGKKPSNIQELVDVIVSEAAVPTPTISFRCHVVGLEDAEFVICMDMKEVCKAERRIMSRHMIASWCSADALSSDLRKEVERINLETEHAVCCNTMTALRNALIREKTNKEG